MDFVEEENWQEKPSMSMKDSKAVFLLMEGSDNSVDRWGIGPELDLHEGKASIDREGGRGDVSDGCTGKILLESVCDNR